MSEHMKTHHTSSRRHHEPSVLYMTYDHKTYAIPRELADKYLVVSVDTTDAENAWVSSEAVFEELEEKLTKAGSLLKGLRTREGLSQVLFARKLGLTQANLSKMENGRRPIGKNIAKRIEKNFKVNYRYFLE
jgi:DNA-binding transcriptional regulator YiaG